MGTYLVSGVAGFIGQRVARMLIDSAHIVIGIDNLNGYYDPRLKLCRLGELAKRAGCFDSFCAQVGENYLESATPDSVLIKIELSSSLFQYRSIDVEDAQQIRALVSEHRFDAVFNLAARAGVRASMLDPHVYLRTNTHGALNILEALRHAGGGKMVLASTSSLYAGCPLPFSEDNPVNIPISPYAASKKAAEVFAATYNKLFGIDVSVLRYFTVYGPAGRPDMAPLRFIKWIVEGVPITLYGDGSQSRDFTYVDDIARGTIRAAKPLGYEVINLGGGRTPITVMRIIRLIEHMTGRKAKIDMKPSHPADMRDTGANILKAKQLLDWEPMIDVDEGFARTVEWYLANQKWLKSVEF